MTCLQYRPRPLLANRSFDMIRNPQILLLRKLVVSLRGISTGIFIRLLLCDFACRTCVEVYRVLVAIVEIGGSFLAMMEGFRLCLY